MKIILRLCVLFVIFYSLQTMSMRSSGDTIMFGQRRVSSPEVEQYRRDTWFLEIMKSEVKDLLAIEDGNPQEVIQHRKELAEKLKTKGCDLAAVYRLLKRVEAAFEETPDLPDVSFNLQRIKDMMPYLNFPWKQLEKEESEQESLFRVLVRHAYLLHVKGDSVLLKDMLGIGKDRLPEDLRLPQAVINKAKNLFDPAALVDIIRTLNAV